MINLNFLCGFRPLLFFFSLLFFSCDILYSQNPNGVPAEEVQKQDIVNRLKVLKGYGADVNAALSSTIPAAKQASANKAIPAPSVYESGASYNTLIQQTRLAYLNFLKNKVKVPANKLYTEMLNPWQDFTTDLLNANPQGVAGQSVSIKNVINGEQYVAFWVSNLDSKAQSIKLSVAKAFNKSQLSFYDVRFILSRSYKNVPDALIPLTGAVSIAPGEVKVFFISAKGLQSGTENGNIQITGGLGSTSIPVSIQNYSININTANTGLNAINWAYYNFPILKGNEGEATKDLKEHYINTISIPHGVLPLVQKPFASRGIDQYISQYKQFNNILLEVDLRRLSKQQGYLSPAWQSLYKEWYTFVINYLRSNGAGNRDVYLYVIDEPKPAELSFTTDFVKWAKKEIPGVKLYATINNQPCTDGLLPLLDVAQLYNRSLLNLNIKTEDMSKIWIYDTKSKSLGPYVSFRLMAWEAFFKGYGGIGFWDYADIAKINGNPGSVWNDFDGPYADYNVVYDLDGKIVSSRRWEAFKMGIEDYCILSAYAKKYGVTAAKQYCQKVLKNSNDSGLADATRNEILSRL